MIESGEANLSKLKSAIWLLPAALAVHVLGHAVHTSSGRFGSERMLRAS